MNAPNSLGEAPVRSLFFRYYIPALTSILSTTLHQLVNGVILGRQVGKEGLAAVGLYGPVTIVFIAFTLPVMIGGGILISKNIGAGNPAKARQILQFATTLALLFGGLIALSAPFLVKPLARFLAGSENLVLIEQTSKYIFWQLLVMPFFFLRMFWGNFISNDNGPKVSRNASLMAVLINIVLDILLVIVFSLGVSGASMATAVSMLVTTVYLFLHIRKGGGHLNFSQFRLSLKLDEWKALLKLGLPSFASEVAFSSGLLLVNQRIVEYGPLAVSAFGLVNHLSFVFIRLFTAAMIASLPIISYNIGARLPKRVLETFTFAFGYTILLGALVMGVGLFAGNALVALFSGDSSPEFRQVAGKAVALYFILFLAAGPNYILAAYFQSIGQSTLSTVINVLKGVVFISLLLQILPPYLGLSGIWLARSLAEILTLLTVGTYTLFKKSTYYKEEAIVRLT